MDRIEKKRRIEGGMKPGKKEEEVTQLSKPVIGGEERRENCRIEKHR